jgi:hypothetical protein
LSAIDVPGDTSKFDANSHAGDLGLAHRCRFEDILERHCDAIKDRAQQVGKD